MKLNVPGKFHSVKSQLTLKLFLPPADAALV
jgi:hypothetical protein